MSRATHRRCRPRGSRSKEAESRLYQATHGGSGLPSDSSPIPDPDDMAAIARLLFSDYLLPFEALSVLLLAALVGAFVLARREKTS